MGYKPNPMLASLASKRFSQSAALEGTPIALLEFPANGEDAPPPRQYRADLEASAKTLGYSTMILSSEELASYNNPARTLYNRGVTGLVIVGQPKPETFAEGEVWSHFALVSCGRFRSSLRMNCVRPNIFQAIKLAFQKSQQRGYRRIGFAFGQHGLTLEDDEARLGAAHAMLRNLEPENRLPVYEGRFDDEKAKVQWIRAHRPDVVIGFTDGDWYMLRDAGFRIPEDIGFVSLQLDPHHMLERNIAGLCQKTDRIAQESISLVDQLIRHKTIGFPEYPRDVLIASVWHEAKSIRDAQPVESASST
jgi:DNA-binding LacI/PurR family transcriptional regulator